MNGSNIPVATESGPKVATSAWAETPAADPTPGDGQVVVHGQRFLRADSAGRLLEPASSATPRAPQSLTDQWVEVADLAGLHGCELQNDSSVDMFVTYGGADAPEGDVGLRLRKGTTRFFAPPAEAGYVGKIYGRAESGTGNILRKNLW